MNKILAILTFFLITFQLSAQDKMRVERGDAVDKSKPIWNVFVDDDNQKWVGNSEGLFKVLSINNAVKEPLRADEWALLQYRSGNADLRVSKTALKKFIPNLSDVNTAHLDKNKQHLWIGTTETGLYQFSLSPLQLIKHFTRDNSDLEVNIINFIEIEPSGRMWIGTPEGVVWGKNGRWNIDEKYLEFVGVAFNGSKTFIISEEWLWEVTSKNKWIEIELNPQQFKGLLIDGELDSKGRLWLASEIVTRTDPATGGIEPFAAPEYYTSEFAAQIKVDQDDALWIGTRDKGLFIIEKGDAITVSALVENPISCGAFEYDGELAVVVEGGKPPFTYAWNDKKMKGDKPKDLAPGEYTVTVTDSRGKEKTASVTLNDPEVKLTIKQDRPESGIGAGDAGATVSVEGGVPDYKFSWDNQESKATAENLTGGSHTVTVTDDAGCSATATVEIQQNIADLAISIQEVTNLKCADSNNAELTVSVEGGKPPFEFKWSDEKAQGETPKNLSAGKYTLTVSDASGKSSIANHNIAAPETLMAAVEVLAPASTGNADGKATVTIKGGTFPYYQEWDTNEKTVEASKLAAGNHQIVVTDGNGCDTTVGFTVEENILSLNASIEVLSELKCADTKDGVLKVNVNGGKPPYNFEWNDPNMKGDNPMELPAGKYSVKVTDASGKSSEVDAEIKGPKVLTVEVNVSSAANLGKEDGKAKVKVKGGTGKYKYAWSNGETKDVAKALGAGPQSVLVTDENNCAFEFNFEMTEDILPMKVTVEAASPINCFGEETGVLVAEVNGGKPPYTYVWKGTNVTTEKAEKLAAGKYEVVVTDAEGTAATATVELEGPEAIEIEIDVAKNASVNQKDGKAKTKVKGGKGPFTYSWDNGEQNETAEKLGLGTHTVDLKDSNGCTATASIDITEDILEMKVSAEATKGIDCFGGKTGALLVDVNGGKPPYSYKWKGADSSTEKADNLGAGKYEVEVTDAEGTAATVSVELEGPEAIEVEVDVVQNASVDQKDGKAKTKVKGGKGPFTYSWDNGEKKETAEMLGLGAHTVDIKDSNGCMATASIDITEDILEMKVTAEATNEVKCFGEKTGALVVAVNGGKPPYSYKWNGTDATTEKAGNLAAGKYEVIVTDAVGTDAKTTVELESPKELKIAIDVLKAASANKKDGKAKASVSGGKGPYTFTWNNGEKSDTAEKLGLGNHTIEIKDSNGCVASESIDVTEDILPLAITLKVDQEIGCHGKNSGSVSSEVTGGKSPFTYSWSNGQTGESVGKLAAGDYTLEVEDASGLKKTAKISLSQPEPLGIELKKTPASSEVSSDGKVTATGVGGAGNYQFSWSTGGTGPTVEKLKQGSYDVAVKDENGCEADIKFDLKSKQIPQLTAATLQRGQTMRLDKLYFKADSSSIEPSSLPTMDELFEFLTENGSVAIEIGGHTNNIPTHDFCDRLSTERAKAVADFLVGKGIDPKRVLYKGYGKRKPKFTNKTKDGRRKNQRVEIKVLSI